MNITDFRNPVHAILGTDAVWGNFFSFLLPKDMSALVLIDRYARQQITLLCENKEIIGNIFRNKLFELTLTSALFLDIQRNYDEGYGFLFDSTLAVASLRQIQSLCRASYRDNPNLTSTILTKISKDSLNALFLAEYHNCKGCK